MNAKSIKVILLSAAINNRLILSAAQKLYTQFSAVSFFSIKEVKYSPNLHRSSSVAGGNINPFVELGTVQVECHIPLLNAVQSSALPYDIKGVVAVSLTIMGFG